MNKQPTKDPPLRPDGKCAGPGCNRVRPPVADANNDPFCSTGCAHSYWGIDQSGRPITDDEEGTDA